MARNQANTSDPSSGSSTPELGGPGEADPLLADEGSRSRASSVSDRAESVQRYSGLGARRRGPAPFVVRADSSMSAASSAVPFRSTLPESGERSPRGVDLVFPEAVPAALPQHQIAQTDVRQGASSGKDLILRLIQILERKNANLKVSVRDTNTATSSGAPIPMKSIYQSVAGSNLQEKQSPSLAQVSSVSCEAALSDLQAFSWEYSVAPEAPPLSASGARAVPRDQLQVRLTGADLGQQVRQLDLLLRSVVELGAYTEINLSGLPNEKNLQLGTAQVGAPQVSWQEIAQALLKRACFKGPSGIQLDAGPAEVIENWLNANIPVLATSASSPTTTTQAAVLSALGDHNPDELPHSLSPSDPRGDPSAQSNPPLPLQPAAPEQVEQRSRASSVASAASSQAQPVEEDKANEVVRLFSKP